MFSLPNVRLSGRREGRVPAHQGAQAGEQHRWLDRLDHVVVGAGLQAEDVIEIVLLGGEYEDRQVRDPADLPAHLQTILSGEHEVENHHLRLEVEEGGERGITAMHLAHFETMLGKETGDQAGELLVVFDEQYLAEGRAVHRVSSVGAESAGIICARFRRSSSDSFEIGLRSAEAAGNTPGSACTLAG